MAHVDNGNCTKFLHFAVTKFFILVNVWSETLYKFPKENVSKLGIEHCVPSENDITAIDIQEGTLIFL